MQLGIWESDVTAKLPQRVLAETGRQTTFGGCSAYLAIQRQIKYILTNVFAFCSTVSHFQFSVLKTVGKKFANLTLTVNFAYRHYHVQCIAQPTTSSVIYICYSTYHIFLLKSLSQHFLKSTVAAYDSLLCLSLRPSLFAGVLSSHLS